MLINYVAGEECRIAIVDVPSKSGATGKLEELYHERPDSESHVGNIYKGRVTNVEPSIQAAFIDFGLERNGFLHISDLHPMYFGEATDQTERVGKKTPRRDRPPIQNCLKRGQEILVQVLKEGIGTKGPTLTSYLSIPGRFVVMMPHMERSGVSRKTEDDDLRREMKKILDELGPPEGFGFIVRTAGLGRNKTDLKRDLAYLQRLWKLIERRMKSSGGIGELYTESDLVIRTIRDVFSSDIERIIVDDVGAAKRARDFLAIANPRSTSKVLVYSDPIPLFHRFDIESQIEDINARTVPLPSGGSLVIDQTEALVAIDVNSGKSRSSNDAESTAYKTNKEAADEVCRQLRLRDLGGVVVVDLIDMISLKHRRDIEGRFRENLKNDRARTRVNAITQFGILEMTRQRMRASLKKSIYADCSSCQGAGQVKSAESVALDAMRRLALVMHRQQVARIELTVSPDVAFQLLNRKRASVVELESRFGKPIMVRVHSGLIDQIELAAFDDRGGSVDPMKLSRPGKPRLDPVDEMSNAPAPAVIDEEESDDDGGEAPKKKRRRRRRGGRGRGKKAESTTDESTDEPEVVTEATAAKAESDTETNPEAEAQEPDSESDSKPRRRRGRRGGRRHKRKTGDGETDQPTEEKQENQDEPVAKEDEAQAAKPKPRRRGRRGGRGRKKKNTNGETESADAKPVDSGVDPAPAIKKKTASRKKSVTKKVAKSTKPQPSPIVEAVD